MFYKSKCGGGLLERVFRVTTMRGLGGLNQGMRYKTNLLSVSAWRTPLRGNGPELESLHVVRGFLVIGGIFRASRQKVGRKDIIRARINTIERMVTSMSREIITGCWLRSQDLAESWGLADIKYL